MTVRDFVCLPGEDVVFYNNYPGVNEGCLLDSSSTVITKEDYLSRNLTTPCTEIKGLPAVKQINAYDKVICGKRGGTPFLTATRPDYESGLCP